PTQGCFILRKFSLDKQTYNPGETINGYVEWVFAKCCPNCIVYALIYDQFGSEVTRIWAGGDSGYTHMVLSKSFSLKAQTQAGTYCLSLNVAYDYSPPRPDQGVISKTCYSVTSIGSIRVIAQYVDGGVASNAKVYVDGQFKGYTDSSGVLLVSVPSGSHTVKVSQDVLGITDKYISDALSVNVPVGACVDAKVTLKCSGDCVKITGGVASPSTAKPGDTITVTVKYVFFHCCSGCCIVKANAFGDWAKTTQLAVIHDGCEGQFHTEITKSFTFTLPSSISAGTHYVRVGFNYDYSFKTSYDDLSTTTHIDIPISVPGSPDLTVAYPLSFSPSTVQPGGSITVTWTEKNIGYGGAGSYRVGVYLGVSEYGVEYLLGSFQRSGLPAGASSTYTATLTVPSSVPAGQYYVVVWIDDTQVVAESNENNNRGSSTPNKVTILPPPKLTVTVKHADNSPASGAKVCAGSTCGYADSQ
ncbi:MAG: CARDB domain-containing protein, partial [Desulfofundulus sp.]